MNLTKIYGFLKLAQDVISLVIPVVETLIKRDINGDGKIGDTPVSR